MKGVYITENASKLSGLRVGHYENIPSHSISTGCWFASLKHFK